MSKYHAVPTIVGDICFDSKKEAARYQELKLLERAGEIIRLELQPKFEIVVNNVKICDYLGDFRYIDAHNMETVTEDTKGVKTPVYRLKKKLVKAIYGIDILET